MSKSKSPSAESKPAISGESESIADKYFVCTECLVEGNVQSFVDLFYLTHAVAAADESESEAGNNISSYETLQFLKTRLTEAEVSIRQSDYSKVFGAYLDVAKHFQAQHDYKTGTFFLGKAVDVARRAGDLSREAEATSLLGVANERMGNVAAAVAYHEKHRDLLRMAGDRSDSGRHLVAAYKAYAEHLQRAGDVSAAIVYLEKCLMAAKELDDANMSHRERAPEREEGARGEDVAPLALLPQLLEREGGEGQAYELLGQAYHSQKEYAKAVTCFNHFLALTQQQDDRVAEGAACSAIASSCEAMGDVAGCMRHLETLYDLTLVTGDMAAQREACSRLGALYKARGDFRQAVTYLNKAFEISRSVGDVSGVDVARVALGVARGAANREAFLGAVKGNMPALLAWKNRRTPLDLVL